MAMPQLSDEQLEQVREFFTSAAATLLWQQMEAGVMSEWILAEIPDDREKCWFKLQALLVLQATLRDATAMKRMTERAQAGRTTAANPGYGTRSQT